MITTESEYEEMDKLFLLVYPHNYMSDILLIDKMGMVRENFIEIHTKLCVFMEKHHLAKIKQYSSGRCYILEFNKYNCQKVLDAGGLRNYVKANFTRVDNQDLTLDLLNSTNVTKPPTSGGHINETIRAVLIGLLITVTGILINLYLTKVLHLY